MCEPNLSLSTKKSDMYIKVLFRHEDNTTKWYVGKINKIYKNRREVINACWPDDNYTYVVYYPETRRTLKGKINHLHFKLEKISKEDYRAASEKAKEIAADNYDSESDESDESELLVHRQKRLKAEKEEIQSRSKPEIHWRKSVLQRATTEKTSAAAASSANWDLNRSDSDSDDDVPDTVNPNKSSVPASRVQQPANQQKLPRKNPNFIFHTELSKELPNLPNYNGIVSRLLAFCA